MQVNIDDKALKYIRKQGVDAITIYVKGCSS